MANIGKLLAQGAGLYLIPTPDPKLGAMHRIRLITGAGFDRNITFKKRPHQEGATTLTPIASWYKKESDGSIASAALTPGASNTSEYILDGVGGAVYVEVSGGTTGTVDIYWSSAAS